MLEGNGKVDYGRRLRYVRIDILRRNAHTIAARSEHCRLPDASVTEPLPRRPSVAAGSPSLATHTPTSETGACWLLSLASNPAQDSTATQCTRSVFL